MIFERNIVNIDNENKTAVVYFDPYINASNKAKIMLHESLIRINNKFSEEELEDVNAFRYGFYIDNEPIAKDDPIFDTTTDTHFNVDESLIPIRVATCGTIEYPLDQKIYGDYRIEQVDGYVNDMDDALFKDPTYDDEYSEDYEYHADTYKDIDSSNKTHYYFGRDYAQINMLIYNYKDQARDEAEIVINPDEDIVSYGNRRIKKNKDIDIKVPQIATMSYKGEKIAANGIWTRTVPGMTSATGSYVLPRDIKVIVANESADYVDYIGYYTRLGKYAHKHTETDNQDWWIEARNEGHLQPGTESFIFLHNDIKITHELFNNLPQLASRADKAAYGQQYFICLNGHKLTIAEDVNFFNSNVECRFAICDCKGGGIITTGPKVPEYSKVFAHNEKGDIYVWSSSSDTKFSIRDITLKPSARLFEIGNNTDERNFLNSNMQYINVTGRIQELSDNKTNYIYDGVDYIQNNADENKENLLITTEKGASFNKCYFYMNNIETPSSIININTTGEVLFEENKFEYNGLNDENNFVINVTKDDANVVIKKSTFSNTMSRNTINVPYDNATFNVEDLTIKDYELYGNSFMSINGAQNTTVNIDKMISENVVATIANVIDSENSNITIKELTMKKSRGFYLDSKNTKLTIDGAEIANEDYNVDEDFVRVFNNEQILFKNMKVVGGQYDSFIVSSYSNLSNGPEVLFDNVKINDIHLKNNLIKNSYIDADLYFAATKSSIIGTILPSGKAIFNVGASNTSFYDTEVIASKTWSFGTILSYSGSFNKYRTITLAGTVKFKGYENNLMIDKRTTILPNANHKLASDSEVYFAAYSNNHNFFTGWSPKYIERWDWCADFNTPEAASYKNWAYLPSNLFIYDGTNPWVIYAEGIGDEEKLYIGTNFAIVRFYDEDIDPSKSQNVDQYVKANCAPTQLNRVLFGYVARVRQVWIHEGEEDWLGLNTSNWIIDNVESGIENIYYRKLATSHIHLICGYDDWKYCDHLDGTVHRDNDYHDFITVTCSDAIKKQATDIVDYKTSDYEAKTAIYITLDRDITVNQDALDEIPNVKIKNRDTGRTKAVDVVICLQGHILKFAENASVRVTKNKLIICNCVNTGYVTAENDTSSTGALITANTSAAAFEFYNATFSNININRSLVQISARANGVFERVGLDNIKYGSNMADSALIDVTGCGDLTIFDRVNVINSELTDVNPILNINSERLSKEIPERDNSNKHGRDISFVNNKFTHTLMNISQSFNTGLNVIGNISTKSDALAPISISGNNTIVTIYEAEVYKNNDSMAGGVFNIDGDAELIFDTEAIFENNYAVNGGAIYEEEGKVTFNDNVSFKGNVAEKRGGALYVAENDKDKYFKLTCATSSLIFEANDAKINGSAMFIGNGSTNINLPIGTEFINNGILDGNAYVVAFNEDLYIRDVKFTKNLGQGLIANDDENHAKKKVDIRNIEISGNKGKSAIVLTKCTDSQVSIISSISVAKDNKFDYIIHVKDSLKTATIKIEDINISNHNTDADSFNSIIYVKDSGAVILDDVKLLNNLTISGPVFVQGNTVGKGSNVKINYASIAITNKVNIDGNVSIVTNETQTEIYGTKQEKNMTFEYAYFCMADGEVIPDGKQIDITVMNKNTLFFKGWSSKYVANYNKIVPVDGNIESNYMFSPTRVFNFDPYMSGRTTYKIYKKGMGDDQFLGVGNKYAKIHFENQDPEEGPVIPEDALVQYVAIDDKDESDNPIPQKITLDKVLVPDAPMHTQEWHDASSGAYKFDVIQTEFIYQWVIDSDMSKYHPTLDTDDYTFVLKRKHKHIPCLLDVCDGSSHINGIAHGLGAKYNEAATFSNVSNADEIIALLNDTSKRDEFGRIYIGLTCDIDLTGKTTLPNLGGVILCINGYKLKVPNNFNFGTPNGNFTIVNCRNRGAIVPSDNIKRESYLLTNDNYRTLEIFSATFSNFETSYALLNIKTGTFTYEKGGFENNISDSITGLLSINNSVNKPALTGMGFVNNDILNDSPMFTMQGLSWGEALGPNVKLNVPRFNDILIKDNTYVGQLIKISNSIKNINVGKIKLENNKSIMPDSKGAIYIENDDGTNISSPIFVSEIYSKGSMDDDSKAPIIEIGNKAEVTFKEDVKRVVLWQVPMSEALVEHLFQ